jgi:hypothetical protein
MFDKQMLILDRNMYLNVLRFFAEELKLTFKLGHVFLTEVQKSVSSGSRTHTLIPGTYALQLRHLDPSAQEDVSLGQGTCTLQYKKLYLQLWSLNLSAQEPVSSAVCTFHFRSRYPSFMKTSR